MDNNFKLAYRKELDGLRALSVFAVITYHAGIEINGMKIFQGGFLGVDVFFVLSGYLITSIILSEMNSDKFKIMDFYWRRFKRIVPVFLVVLLFTSLISFFIFLPNDLLSYSKSLKSAIYFGSNLFFLGEDSYIADSSLYKPLLHTWSLSVEWQFYIIFPLFMWFVCRYFRKYLFGFILSSALLSFQYSVVLAPKYPDMAFYSLTSRAWELLFGAVLVFFKRDLMLSNMQNPIVSFASKIFPVIGLYIIFYGFFFVSDTSIHPSFVTLLAVLGAGFFILFSNEGELYSDFLSWKPIVGIGLISYSLYLIHQPLFVMFRFLKYEEFRNEQFILMLFISMVFATALYFGVERPFRKRRWALWQWCLMIVTVVLLCTFCLLVEKNEGYPERIPPENRLLFENFKQTEETRLKGKEIGEWYPLGKPHEPCILREPSKACRFGDESWVTLGSSYVGMFEYELQQRLDQIGKGLVSLTYYSCPFFSTDLWMESTPICPIINEKRWQVIKKMNRPKTFFINAPYFLFSEVKVREQDNVYEKQKNRLSQGIKADPQLAWVSFVGNINKLIDMGHRVVVVYPMYNTNVNGFLLVRKKMTQNKTLQKITFERVNAPQREIDSILKLESKLDSLLLDREGLYKIKPLDILCKDNICPLVDEKNGPLFNNGTHLSNYAVSLILDEMSVKLSY